MLPCALRGSRQIPVRLFFNPFNPWTHTTLGRNAVAACEVFERTTRRYPKPEFGIAHTWSTVFPCA